MRQFLKNVIHDALWVTSESSKLLIITTVGVALWVSVPGLPIQPADPIADLIRNYR